jgi:hypothetical protein
MDLEAQSLIVRTLRREGVALSGELCNEAKKARMGVGRLYDALRDLERAGKVGTRTVCRAPSRRLWWLKGAA